MTVTELQIRTDDPRAAFIDEMRSHGFEPPPYPAIEKLDRMPAPGDKPGKKSGWYRYVEFPDDSCEGGVIAIGVFGSWKGNPEKVVWSSKRRDAMSPVAQVRLEEKIKAAKIAHDLALKEARKAAAQRAEEIWEQTDPAPKSHPYLKDKGIKPHGIHVSRGNLVVAVMDGDQIASLQFIGINGKKKFLSGGRVKGCSYRIGEKYTDTVYVDEGFATGATLHEITGDVCYVAFTAGNLLAVGHAVRARHRGARLIIAGDDDHATDGNPGRAKAGAAANALRCKVVFPELGEGAGPDDTDFNDMARLYGAEAVKRVLGRAQ
ncbi:MAG: toprim domain-containing protein [Proteobacteria bacterium]|nr:toprim domain-containing protein [Pseudomonadota bacterium]